MTYGGRQQRFGGAKNGGNRFGSKQPGKASQEAALRSLIAGCRDLEKLPDLSALASMYRMDRREIECLVGAERRRRSEVAA